MNLLKNTLNILQETQYLKAKNNWLSQSSHLTFEPLLLKNGLNVREHLLNIWRTTKVIWAYQCANIEYDKHCHSEEQNRLSFIKNDQLKKNYKELCKLNQTDSKPVEFRTILNSMAYNNDNEGELFTWQSKCRTGMPILISEYFIDMSDALEKFYNIQRERKIWWMLYSANPSRFFVEPFDLSKESTDETYSKNCKSITIKAQFPFGLANMESITLVPLNELSFLDYPNTAVIRSVVNLDLTTADGKEHNRGKVLLLNRKLTPYQILLSNLNKKDEISNKLILHLESVIRKSGLRLYDKPVIKNCYGELNKDLLYFDSLGIPYMLVVDKESLKTGLMKLRNRDTTLYETIHISDIPNYLLSIFK